MADTTQLLLGSETHINTAMNSLEQAEDTGKNIMVELDRQRSVLEKVKDMLRGINQKLTRAGKLMNAISKQLCASKAMLWASVIIILLAIIIVVWLRFFPPGSGKPQSTSTPTPEPTSYPTEIPTTSAPTSYPTIQPTIQPIK